MEAPKADNPEGDPSRTRRLLWPFRTLWRLTASLLSLTGRLLLGLLGITLMGVGVVLSATVVGAVIGIPLFAIGVLLIIRWLW